MAGLIGKTIGDKYELVEQLGRGGMAAVYKAYQPALKRFVAIKILHPEVAADATFMVRFEREAHAVAALRHPHIIQVHDFGSQDGLPYLVMECIEGPSLKQRLTALQKADQLMPHQEVLHVVQGVAGALDFAHSQGIIHRDIKPANIMLTAEQDGDAILTDFGLTRIVNASGLTTSGVLGTPDYISPEQGQGVETDARSDIYSLGVVLYEMLAGQPPFAGQAPVMMILKHVQGELPPLREFNARLSAEVENVVMKALAYAPDDRYQRADELAAALSLVLKPTRTASAGARAPGDRLQPISRKELQRVLQTPPEPPPARTGLQLTVMDGPQRGWAVPLTGRISLGRGPGNTFPLESTQVSRQHAIIEFVGDQALLTDLNSTNGTLVNQQRVTTALLREGDTIQMGDTTLRVERRTI
jgi:serine/threonine protein kinase